GAGRGHCAARPRLSRRHCRRAGEALVGDAGKAHGCVMLIRSRAMSLAQAPERAALAFPPPLWGRDREGGNHKARALLLPPSPALPHKGGGSTLSLPPARAPSHRTIPAPQ